MTKKLESFFNLARKAYTTQPEEQYDRYGVKRGLRNSDGTPVMAGLTSIGDARGYYIQDGERLPAEGKLTYRGIDIRDIVSGCQSEKRFGFEEVIFLLIFGFLPDSDALSEFTEFIGSIREVPNRFVEDMILKAPSKDIMNKLGRSVLALYSYDDNPDDTSFENILRQCFELIARFPALAAYGYQAKAHYHDGKSLILHQPRCDLSTSENFLHMMRADNSFTHLEAEILDLSLVIHAEHGGGNNSSFATRLISSSGTDTYSAISAAVGSLKGPKHGGANAKVLGMINDFKTNLSDITDERQIKEHIVKILKKESFDKSGLVYGMGHAIYTESDPRAILLKAKAKELAIAKGNMAEFTLYDTIEKCTPELFGEVKGGYKEMCANVDLYSGFVYEMLGIPSELYTPIFAISRIVGWSAHRIEEITTCSKIIRPGYKSVVHKTAYVPLSDR